MYHLRDENSCGNDKFQFLSCVHPSNGGHIDRADHPASRRRWLITGHIVIDAFVVRKPSINKRARFRKCFRFWSNQIVLNSGSLQWYCMLLHKPYVSIIQRFGFHRFVKISDFVTCVSYILLKLFCEEGKPVCGLNDFYQIIILIAR